MDEITNFITPLYAGLIGLLIVATSFNVSRHRMRLRVVFGTGNQPELERVIRAHANLIENAPIALILLAAIEAQGFSVAVLHGLGVSLVVGRLLHAYGLSRSSGRTFGRAAGALLTWFMIVLSSLLAIFSVISPTRF